MHNPVLQSALAQALALQDYCKNRRQKPIYSPRQGTIPQITANPLWAPSPGNPRSHREQAPCRAADLQTSTTPPLLPAGFSPTQQFLQSPSAAPRAIQGGSPQHFGLNAVLVGFLRVPTGIAFIISLFHHSPKEPWCLHSCICEAEGKPSWVTEMQEKVEKAMPPLQPPKK